MTATFITAAELRVGDRVETGEGFTLVRAIKKYTKPIFALGGNGISTNSLEVDCGSGEGFYIVPSATIKVRRLAV